MEHQFKPGFEHLCDVRQIVWLRGRLVLIQAGDDERASCICGWCECCSTRGALIELVATHLREAHGVAPGHEAIWDHDS